MPLPPTRVCPPAPCPPYSGRRQRSTDAHTLLAVVDSPVAVGSTRIPVGEGKHSVQLSSACTTPGRQPGAQWRSRMSRCSTKLCAARGRAVIAAIAGCQLQVRSSARFKAGMRIRIYVNDQSTYGEASIAPQAC